LCIALRAATPKAGIVSTARRAAQLRLSFGLAWLHAWQSRTAKDVRADGSGRVVAAIALTSSARLACACIALRDANAESLYGIPTPAARDETAAIDQPTEHVGANAHGIKTRE
jgi:hypothetical protein